MVTSHADPRPRGTTPTMASALEAWAAALDAVARYSELPVVRRGVSMGHLVIVHAASRDVGHLVDARAVPHEDAAALKHDLSAVTGALQRSLEQPFARRLEPDRFLDSLRLRLGESVALVTAAARSGEPPHVRLQALLESEVGAAPRVALLARLEAGPFERLRDAAGDFLTVDIRSAAIAPPPARPGRPTGEAVTRPSLVAPTPRVPAGQQLDRDAVRALCLARDLGKAAAAGAESHPLLVGVPRTDWPRLVEEGRLAIADLVESVRPIAHVTMRGRHRNDDALSRMFEVLTSAAHRYKPDHEGGAQWSTFAWATLHRAYPDVVDVDHFGVPLNRGRVVTTVPWESRPGARQDPPDPRSQPADMVMAGELVAAVEALPPLLREPLTRSIAGESPAEIAERIGASTTAINTRLRRGRDQVAKAIGEPHRRPGPPR